MSQVFPGSFQVNITAGSPTAELIDVDDITAVRPDHTIQIMYRDDVSLALGSTGEGNIVITPTSAGIVCVDEDLGSLAIPLTELNVTYKIRPQIGGFDSSHNGTYQIAITNIEADRVTDNVPNPVAAGVLGSFSIRIDEENPAAEAAAGKVSAGASTQLITVTYTDDLAVDLESVRDSANSAIRGEQSWQHAQHRDDRILRRSAMTARRWSSPTA